jgi:hypothetical protein
MLCSLLLEKLTILALGDYFHRVILTCRLVESISECFANDVVPR